MDSVDCVMEYSSPSLTVDDDVRGFPEGRADSVLSRDSQSNYSVRAGEVCGMLFAHINVSSSNSLDRRQIHRVNDLSKRKSGQRVE
jgi:hypothetical protein